MNKWLHKFMEKPDISDKPDNTDISDKWDGKLENIPGEGPDKPDRLDPSLNLSGLSGRPWGLLEENLEINPRQGDDKTNLNANLSVMSGFVCYPSGNVPLFFSKGSELRDEFEERLAIAEYDGQQTSTQAERIAYLDAFVSVLLTLPYEDAKKDWLGQRVNAAKEWLLDQGIEQPK